MQKVLSFLQLALPWILLIGGLLSITFGSFHDFNDDRWEKYLTTIGSSILASGIFALILKTIQFMGVFKEELNSVIFEAKFLKNRIDLPYFWEKVTKEMVKDKFPHIHGAIMKDVKDTYLPTSHVHYYDNGSNSIEITVVDEVRKIIKVKNVNNFTIIPNDPNEAFSHQYSNKLIRSEGCKDTSCTISSVKVNGSEFKPSVSQNSTPTSLYTYFNVPLKGTKGGYKMEIEVVKTYCLEHDNVIAFTNGYLMNGLKVQIFLDNKMKVNFIDSGTLNSFKTIHNRDTFIEKVYSGIIYKGQGYIVCLEMK